MKNIIGVIAIVLFLSCGDKKAEIPALGEQSFFDFDKVEHYHLAISKSNYDSILANPNKSRLDAGLMQILREKIPVSGIDTLFIPNMDILKFQKHEIAADKHQKLKEIFSVKAAHENPSTTCESIFRDVLVFRNKGKFIGVAKLDLNCESEYLMGARYSSSSFGSKADFESLKAILQNP